MSNIYNPFITTVLSTQIVLHPSQLNNDIYNNLKENLELRLKNKCFKNYGYISNIYEIVEYNQGKIIPEDVNACVQYNVKFSCVLCHPVENNQIICKAKQNTEDMLFLYIKPMNIIAMKNSINTDVFDLDPNSRKIRVINGSVIEEGTYVKVTIIRSSIVDKNDKIIILGRLDDVVSDEEYKEFCDKYYNDESTI